MARVFLARLVCSDVDCAAEVAAEAATLPELERLICDCGCGLEVVAWPDWIEQPAQVIALRPGSAELRDAA